MQTILLYTDFILCIAILVFDVVLYKNLEKTKKDLSLIGSVRKALEVIEREPLGRIYNTCDFCHRSLPNVYLAANNRYVCTSRICQNNFAVYSAANDSQGHSWNLEDGHIGSSGFGGVVDYTASGTYSSGVAHMTSTVTNPWTTVLGAYKLSGAVAISSGYQSPFGWR